MADTSIAPGAQRCATLALVGLPNSGKSTLLNILVGEKLAATSQVAQTTRGRILGVVERGPVQFLFLDTPGFHQPKHSLNERMVRHIDSALEEADLLLWIVDADGYLGAGERAFAKRLKQIGRPVYLILNKLDLLSKGRLLEKVTVYKDLMAFHEIVPVSAKFATNLEPLWTLLEQDAPVGEWHVQDGAFTDQTERAMAAEFIREKVLRKTREEVPHGVAVEIARWVESGTEADESSAYAEVEIPAGGVFIAAEIIVERSGHRKILLGSQGATIKDIRISAQRELKKLLQRPVKLELFVKVEEGWRDRPDKLDRLHL